MGYNSRHEFQIYRSEAVTPKILYSLLDELLEDCFILRGSIVKTDGAFKWYSFSEDVQSLVDKHPDLILIMDYYGEDHGDMSRWYFRCGKEPIAHKFTWPPAPDFED